MGRIKKAAGPKHEATVSPAILDFVNKAGTVPITEIPGHLESFPKRWPLPRGDLYHWIPLLNRFDHILEEFIREYALDSGPQTKPFGISLLERGVVSESKEATTVEASPKEIADLGYREDGDIRLVQSILEFSRTLLENCGNRSIYGSSERLGVLLNTTSLSLLTRTLQLLVRLAQRYHASRQRNTSSQHLSNQLLASHYNIDLEKVQRLAEPFVKLPSTHQKPVHVSASKKGKEKAVPAQDANANDFLDLLKTNTAYMNGSAKPSPNSPPLEHDEVRFEEWGGVALTYYPTSQKDEPKPATPTASQRPSTLSKPSRLSSSDDALEPPSATGNETKTDKSAASRIEITVTQIQTQPIEHILKDTIADTPKDVQYEALSRVRAAHAVVDSLSTRQQLVGIRLLALTNLAYIYSEDVFKTKILQRDSDEPRNLQLTQQICNLLNPPSDTSVEIPTSLETVALGTLEALAKLKMKASDVCSALSVNVNHGVLFHVLRTAVADMKDASPNLDNEREEWREAAFALLDTLPSSTPRTGEALISAGLLDLLVEVLELRTPKAERCFSKTLTFLNSLVGPVRDAFETLASANGLEAISGLMAHEVESSLELAEKGQGLDPAYRNRMVDYQIPFFRQQTLRMIFKITREMMTNNSGNFSRLLRNFVESPNFLTGLRKVMSHPTVFGSSVWSGAVNIMSSFIHNEPTSYAVLSEAGLSTSLLETLSTKPIEPANAPTNDPAGSTQVTEEVDDLPGAGADTEQLLSYFAGKYESEKPAEGRPLAKGILPAADSIISIPHAFGALCLNHSGMDLLKKSNALDTFFEIFESPAHVKTMTTEGELGQVLGSSFDELVRHHPTLKILVLASLLKMIARVKNLCVAKGKQSNSGAKVWLQNADGHNVPAGESSESQGATEADGDVVMEDGQTNGVGLHKALSSDTPLPLSAQGLGTEDDEDPHATTILSYINVAMKFITGFAENNQMCSLLVDAGAADAVLDLATLPVLRYDWNNHVASLEVRRVVHLFAEQKAHLVLPTLAKRTQSSVDELNVLSHYDGSRANSPSFFARFTTPDSPPVVTTSSESDTSMGTSIVQTMVRVQTLCNMLFEIFSQHPFNPRSQHMPFNQVNLADVYISLVRSLGSLHRFCVWEEIILMHRIPERWMKATTVRGYGMGSAEADKIFGFSGSENGALEAGPDTNDDTQQQVSGAEKPSSSSTKKPLTSDDEKSAVFRNIRTLRFLLSQVPSAMIPFFQSLGKSLLGKRRGHSSDMYARQNASMVADAMSSTYVDMFTYEPPHKAGKQELYSYWIVILTSLSRLMIDGSSERVQTQVLTLLLQAFRRDGGFDIIKDILQTFHQEVNSAPSSSEETMSKENATRLVSAFQGIQVVLSFFKPVLSSKSVVDASQSQTLLSFDARPGQAYYFNSHQLLVELRVAVLPVVRSLWESSFVEKASSDIIKSVIDIMRIILDASEEHGVPRQNSDQEKPSHRHYDIHAERTQVLIGKGFDEEAAREALYRCFNDLRSATAYCQRLRGLPDASRLPIPEYDDDKLHPLRSQAQAPASDENQVAQAEQPSLLADFERDIDEDTSAAAAGLAMLSQGERLQPPPADAAQAAVNGAASSAAQIAAPPPAPGVPENQMAEPNQNMEMSLDNLQEGLPDLNLQTVLDTFQDLSNPIASRHPSHTHSGSQSRSTSQSQHGLSSTYVTQEDLNNARNEVRKTLVDRALDVLNVHEDVTFELAEMIRAATTKVADEKAVRVEIGTTLVQSLISFDLDEDMSATGKKIAAYANLLALVLQSNDFFEACSSELRDSFDAFIGFIKIPSNQSASMATTPWIGQTLLVTEKLLAEDSQPPKVSWNPPNADASQFPDDPFSVESSAVSDESKMDLFEALLKLMPSTGKDEAMVLSVVRVIVILTRTRSIASKLAEKKNIQRFFLMIKQLSGMTDDKLTSAVMIVIRHMFEDDNIIRRIIRSEIRNGFETRTSRPTEPQAFARHMNHLAIRAPQTFVEVSNEVLEIAGYESAHRPQQLKLKEESPKVDGPEDPPAEPSKAQNELNKELSVDNAAQGKAQSLESDQNSAQKSKVVEKAPTVEHPSGVIHYLLSELLSYKDTEDSAGPTAKFGADEKRSPTSAESGPATSTSINEGSTMLDVSSPSATASVGVPSLPDNKKTDIKPEQHPIHTYRCFLLQCLTELLQSYNQAKVEFINFSRKADAKATTPSKPRAHVLNYLLTDAIPVGTLQNEESISYKKNEITSNWAISTIVALCLRTNEHGYERKPGTVDEDDQTDLVFVRKFVLEHALKAYKDAINSDEDIHIKYGRLLDLADLFHRLMTGQLLAKGMFPPNGLELGPQKAIAKIMFEKNFIAALTSSIADININFKGADRAIKYILRPLKQLTITAVQLSESSSISTTPGTSDEDEISSASSVSEVDDGREETPDLFRNSTLGMFEPNREDESSSDGSRSDDEEMYDDEYDDGIEYGDDLEGPDPDDVISDEDEELDDVGPIEGVNGDQPMEITMDEEVEEEEDLSEDDDDLDDSDGQDDMDDLDEVNGDNENTSLADDDEEEWQDDDGDIVDSDEPLHHDIVIDSHSHHQAEDAIRDAVHGYGGPEAALQRLEGHLDGGPSDFLMDVREGRYMDDVVRHEEDEDDEDDEDDGEDMDEDEIAYEPDYDENGDQLPDPEWGWDDPADEDSYPHGHHHHHHHHNRHNYPRPPHPRSLPDPWTIFPHGAPSRGGPLYRSHRTTGGPRSADDGTNPLLQRGDRSSGPSTPRRSAFSDGGQPSGLMEAIFGGRGPGSRDHAPGSLIHNLLSAIGQGNPAITATPGPGGNLHIQIAGPSGEGITPGSLHQGVRAIISESRHPQPWESHRPEGRPPLATFIPQSTWQRWTDEAKMLFGASEVQNKGMRVTNTLLRLMVPPAIEKKRKQDEIEKKRREEAEKTREEEAKLKAEQEKKEKEEREKHEQEEAAEAAAAAQTRAEAEAEEAAATRENQPSLQAVQDEGRDEEPPEEMEGVEVTAPQTEQPATSTDTTETGAQTEEPVAEPAERQFVTFNGAPLDITGMGIDMAYLDALPEEIRNEVLMTELAQRRAQNAATGEPQPTEIDNEFLNALPEEIRQELLQQERQERRRRDREEARRQQQAAGGAAQPEEMDPASFLASLDPTLRQHVLMEQDEEMLSHLPADIAAEARALGGDRSLHRFAGGARMARPSAIGRDLRPPQTAKKPPRRQIVQMLDRNGVATLLRLMFIQQPVNLKSVLCGILHDVVQNRQNRAEVIGLLLTLLQDGSADTNAVERSYAQLSLRAKESKDSKAPLKRMLTGTSIPNVAGVSELKVTPLMVIQQCLSSLAFLTAHNLHVPSFFLNENEASFSAKGKGSKKGKGKENKASRYPINALLRLLDRPLVTENMGCVEQLADLLQRITYPLMILLRKEKEPAKEDKKDEEKVQDQAMTEDTATGTNATEATPETAFEPADAASTSPMADVQATTEYSQPAEASEAGGDAKDKGAIGSKEDDKKDSPKRPRALVPPTIPDENLQLVVNIITARECPSNTFRATLSTMTNLCALPGAKDVFGKRLVGSALELGQLVLNDLNELIPQVKDAASGNELSATALTKFSPQLSDQSKLLRVLKALDYLFDPKREDNKTKVDGESKEIEESSATSKADLVTTLYEDPTFAMLWEQLGECLKAIRQGKNMLNVATILLPLVEALMVVCTNTASKDASQTKAIKEVAVSSPAPETHVESLFFRFTEEHRKILNELVRQNPKLMSGTFQLLVRNPKVLEFDNKRNYFTRRLHQKNHETRHSQPPLQLAVRRDQVFLDSFKFLSFKSGDEIKYGKLNIRFHGEEGVDAGGVTREWFQVLSRQMFNPDYALFIPVASDRTTFHPNKLSKVNEEHLMFFRFIGRIIGKALYEGRALDCHFSRAVYKRILGRTVSIKDMETLDLDYYKSLVWMLENDITEIITETMSVETDDFGVTEIVDLVENGRNIPVTEENKQEYVQLVVEYRLVGSVETQLEKFLEGFHDIVPPELISIFNEQELELLISGLPDIDVEDWKNHTEYHNYQVASPQIQWFWRAVRSFDKEERAKLLQFVTGTSKVPLNGFGQLEGMNGFSRFNVHRDYGNKDRLPSSHTCFNQLDLPEYEDYESLRKQLYTAMTAGSEYFGFA